MPSKLDAQLRSSAANYKRLAPFIAAVDATPENHFTFHASGFMPLSIERLESESWWGYPVYSMMHYYIQEGDVMRDPDMTFAVLHEGEKVVPLTFRQDGAPFTPYGTLYQEVFSGPDKYQPALLKDLDSFLSSWTRNILSQGFKPDEPTRHVSLDDFASAYAPPDESSADDVASFVATALLGDCDRSPMSEEDAFIALDNWIREGVELPEGITAARLSAEWNRQIAAP